MSEEDPRAQKLTYWALGFIGTILLAGGAAWLTSIDTRLSRLEARDIQLFGRVVKIETMLEVWLRTKGIDFDEETPDTE